MQSEPPKQKRRWFQFSLRTLLIATVVSAIASAWIGKWIVRKSREREIAGEIVKSGGVVRYDYQAANIQAAPSGPKWLRRVLGDNAFSQLNEVDLDGATDAELASIGELDDLQTLRVTGRDVTDAGLAHLRSLSRLETLELWNTAISDAGLANVRELPCLRVLWLGDTSISDAGLQSLARIKHLQVLHLEGTNVSDTGLPRIASLNRLQELELQGTRVTRKGLDELQRALPNCTINR